MGEFQQEKGRNCEEKINEILTKLGWELSEYNRDISGSSNYEVGVDAFYTYEDPYLNKRTGIFVETKNRMHKSINSSFLSETVNNMSEKIHRLPSSPHFKQQMNLGKAISINTGVINFWIDDFDSKIANKFKNILSEINVPSNKGKSTQRIFILDNTVIQKAMSIIDTWGDLQKESNNNAYVYYPCLPTYSNRPVERKLVTIEMLFSRFIFFVHYKKYTGTEDDSKHIKCLDILYFDDIAVDSLLLMYSALEIYQLLKEDVGELNIYLYNKQPSEAHILPYVKDEISRKISHDIDLDNQPHITHDINIIFKNMRHFDDIYQWGDI